MNTREGGGRGGGGGGCEVMVLAAGERITRARRYVITFFFCNVSEMCLALAQSRHFRGPGPRASERVSERASESASSARCASSYKHAYTRTHVSARALLLSFSHGNGCTAGAFCCAPSGL